MVDAMVVVGSPNSSNTQRLKEVAERAGCARAALVNRAGEIDWSVFGSIASLGVTAGASAPEVLVEEVIGAFAERYAVTRRDRDHGAKRACSFRCRACSGRTRPRSSGVAKLARVLERCRSRAIVSFREFESLLEGYGFRLVRVSGSHRIYRHDQLRRSLSVQPDGKDAKAVSGPDAGSMRSTNSVCA